MSSHHPDDQDIDAQDLLGTRTPRSPDEQRALERCMADHPSSQSRTLNLDAELQQLLAGEDPHHTD